VTVGDYVERSVTLARFARGPREQREIGPTPLIRGTEGIEILRTVNSDTSLAFDGDSSERGSRRDERDGVIVLPVRP